MTDDEKQKAMREWLDRKPPAGNWRDFEREPCACDGRGWIVRPAKDYGFVMTRCPRCNP